MIQLSHTQKELYLRCPKAYYITYILKLREKKVGSALPFGSAIDDGVDYLLKNKDKKDALSKAKELFLNKWMNPTINYKKITKDYEKYINYSKSDSIEDFLLEKSDDNNPHTILMRKGLSMLDAYYEQIIPRIKKVIGTQVKYETFNDIGDKIVGVGDLECIWEDGSHVLFDNKTSSAKYKETKIKEEGGQLALYDMISNFKNEEVGYIVIPKKFRKLKEPICEIQVLKEPVCKDLAQKTLDEYLEVLYNIKMGNFPSNHPNCDTFFGKCICQKWIESEGTNYEDFEFVGKGYK